MNVEHNSMKHLSRLDNLQEEEDENSINGIDNNVYLKFEALKRKSTLIDEIKDFSQTVVFRAKSAAIEAIKPENVYEFKDRVTQIKKEEKEHTKTTQTQAKQAPKYGCAACKDSRFTSVSFYKNNSSFFISILAYVLLSIFFILIQLLVLFPNVYWYVAMARACGILINFNSCLIILLVLRRLSTWVRNTVLGPKFAVLDDFLIFHKFIGILILVLSFIHTLGQCINMCTYLELLLVNPHVYWKLNTFLDYLSSDYLSSIESTGNSSNVTSVALGTYAELLFSINYGHGLVGGCAPITGWILLIILLIMTFFAMPFIRRKGFFQVILS